LPDGLDCQTIRASETIMHYLIDGHNLIAKMADIDLDDPNDEALLVLRLRSWVIGSRKRRATVIFDGGLPGGRSRFHSSDQLGVIFASEGRTADALLIRRMQKAKNPAEYTLVSSDQEVIDAARARHVRHLTSEAFASRLSEFGQQEKREPTPEAPGEAQKPAVSQEEVAEWLALFDAAPKMRREAPQPRPGQKAAQEPAGAKKASPQPETRKDVDPASLKRGESKLSDDELDEWLRLFGPGS
jgi:predicted RNA-binding protein with PIN domain